MERKSSKYPIVHSTVLVNLPLTTSAVVLKISKETYPQLICMVLIWLIATFIFILDIFVECQWN